MSRHSTFVDLLRDRAADTPGRLASISLKDGETEGARLSFGEIDTRAAAIAAALLERGRPGEPVLVPATTSGEFLTAFLGCLYAGMPAVPVAGAHDMKVRVLPYGGIERAPVGRFLG